MTLLTDNSVRSINTSLLAIQKSEERIENLTKGIIGTLVISANKEMPSEYLKCDGKEFDKKKYPELYKVLKVNITPFIADISKDISYYILAKK